MHLQLPAGEPPAGPWREMPLGALASMLAELVGPVTGRPAIVAVDGRSGSGKTTLAARLHAAVPRSAVVHTDDVAWHHSFFDWSDLLAHDVLEPLRRGKSVRYRPPTWVEMGRQGAIEVPAGLALVLVEGVGSARRELANVLDAVVWVQSDAAEAERQGIARDAAAGATSGIEGATRFWHEWMAQETPFLADQQPWERADVVVRGTTTAAYNADRIVLGQGR